MLSEEQIKNFQLLYKNRFGVDISREAAIEQGKKLVRLLELVYQPMTKQEFATIQARRAKGINNNLI